MSNVCRVVVGVVVDVGDVRNVDGGDVEAEVNHVVLMLFMLSTCQLFLENVNNMINFNTINRLVKNIINIKTT